MPKRLTETGSKKWTASYRRLPPRLKCVREYLYDHCDHAGLWDVDYEAMNLYVGEPVSEAEVLECYGWRIVPVASGTKYFLPEFMLWNYKKKALNPGNNCQRSALELLAAVGITDWTIFVDRPELRPEPVQGVMAAVLSPSERPGLTSGAKQALVGFWRGMPGATRRLDD